MTDSPTVQSRLTLERRILRCFCSEEIPASLCAELKDLLIAHVWGDPDDRVVFDCLRRLTDRNNIMPWQLREQLPAQATRMGFPDVKWENYVGQETADQPDVRNLVGQLLATN